MIEGKRVQLRAIEKTDLPKFVRWLNDPEVIENLYLYVPISLGQEENWYTRVLQNPVEEQPLAIEIRLNEDWIPIGTLAFVSINWHDHSSEIGIAIGEKAYWNKGYGADALKLLLWYGFQTIGLNRIWLRVYEGNERGIHAYLKAGFVHEGIMRQARWKNGKFINMHIMSVLREEWKDQD